MGKNIEKGVKINFGRVNKARKVKVRKVKESSQGMGEVEKRVKLCKKWMTHEHESENHTVVGC